MFISTHIAKYAVNVAFDSIFDSRSAPIESIEELKQMMLDEQFAKIDRVLTDLNSRLASHDHIDRNLWGQIRECRIQIAFRIERIFKKTLEDEWKSKRLFESIRSREDRALRVGLASYQLFCEYLVLFKAENIAAKHVDETQIELLSTQFELIQKVANTLMRSVSIFPCWDQAKDRIFIDPNWLPPMEKVEEFQRNLLTVRGKVGERSTKDHILQIAEALHSLLQVGRDG